jgi:PAS domain-containing protein
MALRPHGRAVLRRPAAAADVRDPAQRIADVLAAALHTAVEVVDRDLVRLAASGPDAGRLQARPDPALYAACMRSALPAWGRAEGAGRAVPVVACPLVAGGAVLGAVGLFPAVEGQAALLRAHAQQVTDLVAAMSEPLRGALGWEPLTALGGRTEQMEAVLESLPDGLLVVDQSGVVQYCNRAALRMLHADMDLSGQPLVHWYAPAGGPGAAGPPARANPREVVFERRGHRFEFVESRVPLRPGGRPGATVLILRLPEAGSARARPSLPTLDEAERRLIDEALARHGTTGSGKRRAARALGISLATLYRKLHRAARSRRR